MLTMNSIHMHCLELVKILFLHGKIGEDTVYHMHEGTGMLVYKSGDEVYVAKPGEGFVSLTTVASNLQADV